MLGATKSIEAVPLAGASPDVTLPKVHRKDGRGPAILFADVSRSMLLHEQLGDQAARMVIDALLALAEKAVTAYGGRVVRSIGDEILAVLPNADAAARAARDLLIGVDAIDAPHGVRPSMHVGLHSGGFMERAGDVFGDAVNVASRLTAHAQPGQILTTSASAPGISLSVRRSMRRLGPLDIRGRIDQIQVEEIAWRDTADEEATVTKFAPVAALGTARIRLDYEGRQWTLDARIKHLSIGRDPGSDLVIANIDASRSHGFIEYRNGAFYYIDTSLNGSYVTFGNAGETLVQRNQVLLSGRGMICLGQPAGRSEQLVFEVTSPTS